MVGLSEGDLWRGRQPHLPVRPERLPQLGARREQPSHPTDTTTYAYDANGNLASTSAGRTYTYDPLNRMTQAAGPGGTVNFTYNGDGLKVQRSGPDGVTRYYHAGIRPIWETDGAEH